MSSAPLAITGPSLAGGADLPGAAAINSSVVLGISTPAALKTLVLYQIGQVKPSMGKAIMVPSAVLYWEMAESRNLSARPHSLEIVVDRNSNTIFYPIKGAADSARENQIGFFASGYAVSTFKGISASTYTSSSEGDVGIGGHEIVKNRFNRSDLGIVRSPVMPHCQCNRFSRVAAGVVACTQPESWR